MNLPSRTTTRANTFVVIADRGGLRAYRVGETATRGSSLQLVYALDIPNANNLSRAHRTSATPDWAQLDVEVSRRICQQLAEQIAKIVQIENAEGWSFAAPQSIHAEIVRRLPLGIRQRIVGHVRADLVKTPVGKLRGHFRLPQPI